MPVEYAHALYSSLASASSKEEALERVDELIAVLERNGKRKALPSILRELERLHAQSHAQKPTLVVANEASTATAKVELGTHIAKDVHADITVDDNLVGGWRYSDNDTLIDASYKTALLNLYRKVTAI